MRDGRLRHVTRAIAFEPEESRVAIPPDKPGFGVLQLLQRMQRGHKFPGRNVFIERARLIRRRDTASLRFVRRAQLLIEPGQKTPYIARAKWINQYMRGR